MTDPTVTHRFQDNRAVETTRADGRRGDVAGAAAVPRLAAIQQGYEEAKAGIVDPMRARAEDDADPLPATEKIDIRQVALPAVPAGTREAAAAAPPPARRSWWRGLRRAWYEAHSSGASQS